MKQFFQTDPDTRQYCRAFSPTTYQFTDIVPFHSKAASPYRDYYAVAAETIDLSAYTIRQLEQTVEPYYCSLRGLVSAYGSDTTLPEILQIIAECVFENPSSEEYVRFFNKNGDFIFEVTYNNDSVQFDKTSGTPFVEGKDLTFEYRHISDDELSDPDEKACYDAIAQIKSTTPAALAFRRTRSRDIHYAV